MQNTILSMGIALVSFAGAAQTQQTDTLHIKDLAEVTLVGRTSKSDYQQMPEVVGTQIYAGKKNSLIVMENVQANVAKNNMRQVMAKIPGIHIWESDPSGIQIGIAARGLSPNRSWEFNIRQNGYDVSADPFGYPEAYYNPPLQAVQRIEVVRGQASLQYGPQFGGMVNYILKNGSDIDKKFQYEGQQTIGSSNLVNTFNAVGGKSKKVQYYSFIDFKNGDGSRDNSRFNTKAVFATATYQLSKKITLTAEMMHSHIRSQQPGGLSDDQMENDISTSYRSRNWFDIEWTNPALVAKFNPNENLRWETKLFATIGNRNSVGFLQNITIKDSINPATLQYANRSVNADKYRNYALESRILAKYKMGKMKNTFTGGIRLYTGETHRLTDGKGTMGIDYDMTVLGNYGKDIRFGSKNMAGYVENAFGIGSNLLVIPGIRYEWLQGEANGRNSYDAAGSEILLQNVKRSRSFALAGIAVEYHLNNNLEIYSNITQAYRPIQFANLQAPPSTDVVDPNLKDANGYNFDIGLRGSPTKYLQLDLSGFYLQYNDRVGTITPTGTTARLITNIGNSTSRGIEAFAQANLASLAAKQNFDLLVYGTYSYIDARYSSNFKDTKIKGNKVENAPSNIFRSGVTGGMKNILATLQYCYVSSTFSDATNTVIPSTNAQNGLIPAYSTFDLTMSYKYSKSLNFKVGINNLLNEKYFTRRAGGYPGPGILPGDPRNFFLTVATKL